MTQKEIRDQIENMIRMNRISSAVVNESQFKAMDLLPFVDSLLNADAKNLILNHKTYSTIHQWNRKVDDNKYKGEQAYALGEFLGKLNISNYETLQLCNYVREVSQVKYYGVTATLEKVGEATIKMVNMLNDLASRNLVRAVLAPLMSVELVGGKIVVVSYIAVDKPNEALVQSLYGALQFQEGGVPLEII